MTFLITATLIVFALNYPLDFNEPIYSIVNKIEKNYQPLSLSEIKQLEEKYGFNKNIPQQYKEQMLIALSHYPELVNTPIEVKTVQNSSYPLISIPQISSLLSPGEERKYLILINENEKAFPDELLLKNIPYNAQVGILGHELSHTLFYTQKNIPELIAPGIMYLLGSFQEKFEKTADIRTIQHGLGWQLLDFSTFVRNRLSDSKYLSWIEKNYLSPDEIKQVMKGMKEYNLQNYGQNQ
ncbi:MAG TPA: hypothetical protein VIK89_14345 [Cytophagaceae bacterium]